jgi:hypothetical protein
MLLLANAAGLQVLPGADTAFLDRKHCYCAAPIFWLRLVLLRLASCCLVLFVALGSVLLLLTSLLATLFACCALNDGKRNQKRLMGMTAYMAELSCDILLHNVYPINLGASANR